MSIPRILRGLFVAATSLAACGGGPDAGLATSPPEPPGSAGTGGVNAPDKRDLPHVVIVSIDGFRWDYPELYSTPSIARLIAAGARTLSRLGTGNVSSAEVTRMRWGTAAGTAGSRSTAIRTPWPACW